LFFHSIDSIQIRDKNMHGRAQRQAIKATMYEMPSAMYEMGDMAQQQDTHPLFFNRRLRPSSRILSRSS
jgi:hypothetical protein